MLGLARSMGGYWYTKLKAISLPVWIILLLLPAIPSGFIVEYTQQSHATVFVVNFVAVIPLSSLLAIITDVLVVRKGGHSGTFFVVTLG